MLVFNEMSIEEQRKHRSVERCFLCSIILSQCFLDSFKKLGIFLKCGKVGVIRLNFVGALEEEACLRGANHTEVVVAVACGYSLKAYRLERSYGRELRILNTHSEAGYLSVVGYLKRIAEYGRHTELLHKRRGKLRKGIAYNYHLCQ